MHTSPPSNHGTPHHNRITLLLLGLTILLSGCKNIANELQQKKEALSQEIHDSDLEPTESGDSEPSPVDEPLQTNVSITAISSNQSVNEGEDVTLRVTATGSGPLNYQWQHQNQDIPNATAASLLLSATTETQSGEYRVVVSNPSSQQTSSPVHVSVLKKADTFAVSVSWTLPSLRTDGSALLASELSNVKLYLGDTPQDLDLLITTNNNTGTTLEGLLEGDYYMAISVVDIYGNESDLSQITPLTI